MSEVVVYTSAQVRDGTVKRIMERDYPFQVDVKAARLGHDTFPWPGYGWAKRRLGEQAVTLIETVDGFGNGYGEYRYDPSAQWTRHNDTYFFKDETEATLFKVHWL